MLSNGLKEESWAVVLDIDESILDNSENQERLMATGDTYSDESWHSSVRKEKATALDGARSFIDTVRSTLKGKVVLVTK